MRAWKILERLARVAGWMALASCSAGGGGSKDGAATGGSATSFGGDTLGADASFKLGASGGATGTCTGTAAPGCGDGKIEAGEKCDDGNSTPGDGCSGVCEIEPYYECPNAGQPCVTTIVCGDGKVLPGEACDDGNQKGGDGCAADCRSVEKGYACPTAGAACEKTHVCGDGNADPNEGCDDGNNTNGDGCDSRCRLETGFKCSGAPSVCTATVCGDGKREGAESCDDGNAVPFDGCSGICQAEPSCALGSACTSTCGDGIALGSEECDDGNLRNGDGCSSTCHIEAGFTCKNDSPCALVNGICTMSVPAIFRDQDPSKNPDIEPGFDNQNAITGLVKATLAADNKPALAGAGCTADGSCGTTATGFIHSPTTFSYWYHDVAGINAAYPGSIVLFRNGATTTYVNRWGANGEQWPSYSGISWCANGNPGDSCSMCNVGAGQICLDPCKPWNNNQICVASVTYLDGNPVFFPIDKEPGLVTPAGNFATATIPQPIYNGNWSAEPGGALHNFGFTSEIRYWFKYDATASATLDFVGDDDVWVFVNGTLALDLGGWHVPVEGFFVLNNASAAKFNLKDGSVYQIAVFQTERKKTGSTFKLTLAGFNTAPSDCAPTCGDGVVAAGEACDLGTTKNTGAYDGCNADCTPGPHCGDGVVQGPEETCDDGQSQNTGAYGGCTSSCQRGPYCGDGVVQSDHEHCDDGKNTGDYGTCAPGCVLGARCGDGIVQADQGEECDVGGANGGCDGSGAGCSSACKIIAPR